MLEIDKINTFYGTSHILHDLSLTIPDGAMISVLGRNGVGKSTLLRSIIGLNPPRRGSITFNGRDVTRMRSHRRARLGVAYVPQGREIIADLTVAQNLEVAMFAKGLRSTKVPDFVFDLFPMIKPLMSRRGGVLSGGQQQQVAIARALVQEPDVLLLDEPTEGLQPSVVEEIDRIIRRIHAERNCSILLVEQNLFFVREVTEQFAIMENGRFVIAGDIAQLTDDLVAAHLSV